MAKLFNDIRRGAGYLPGYGSHPGTPMMIGLIAIGAIAGGWFGFGASVLFYVPMWAYGCVERARDYDRDQQKNG